MKKSLSMFFLLLFLASINPVMAECVVQPKGCTQVLDNEEVYVKFWSLQDCMDIMGVEYADHCIIDTRPMGIDNGEIIDKTTLVHHHSSKKGIPVIPTSPIPWPIDPIDPTPEPSCPYFAGNTFYSYNANYFSPVDIFYECLEFNPNIDYHTKTACLNTLNFDYEINGNEVSCKFVEKQPGDCPYFFGQVLGELSYTDETEFMTANMDNFESACRANFIDSNWNDQCQSKFTIFAAEIGVPGCYDGEVCPYEERPVCQVFKIPTPDPTPDPTPEPSCPYDAGDIFYSYDDLYFASDHLVSECLVFNPNVDRNTISVCLNTFNFDYEVSGNTVSCKFIAKQPEDCPYSLGHEFGSISYTDPVAYNSASSDNFETACRAQFIDTNWNDQCKAKYTISPISYWGTNCPDGEECPYLSGVDCAVLKK